MKRNPLYNALDWYFSNLLLVTGIGFLLLVAAAIILAFDYRITSVIVLIIGAVLFFSSIIFFRLFIAPVSSSKSFVPKGFPKSMKWQGLGDEPKWEGKIDDMLVGYRVPLYVYENGKETETPDKKNGRVIGYRISPTLVIHNMVAGGNGWFSEHIRPFIERYGGSLLNSDDVAILRQNYKTVDKMRKKIGDAKLPRRFWYEDGYGDSVAYLEEEKDEYDPDCSGIILKR